MNWSIVVVFLQNAKYDENTSKLVLLCVFLNGILKLFQKIKQQSQKKVLMVIRLLRNRVIK